MHLVYINLSIGSVFESQVVSLLKYYANSNNFKRITLLCGIQNKKQETILTNLFKSSNIEIVSFKIYPNYSFFNFLQTLSLKRCLNKININQNTVFHLRGELLGLLCYEYFKNKKNKVVVDIRGAALEEIIEFQKHNLLTRFKINNIKQSLIYLNKYKIISVVSESLAEYILKLTKVNIENIHINYCLSNKSFNISKSNKNNIRKMLGVSENEFLIVFSSGGNAKWQNFDVLENIAQSNIKILNLSNIKILHPNVINKFVPYNEMPIYLEACDVALIFRNKSIVNKVSCPVKFTEYISCGLPIISNNTIDIINDYILKTKYGILVNSEEEINIDLINSLKQLNRQEISKYGIGKFGIESIANNYQKLYNS